MTFKQLEEFLRSEKWRAGAQRDFEMCGKYARCVFCDRYCDYPCARSYDTLVKRKKEGKTSITYFEFPEPDVKGAFGTDFATEEVSASEELAQVEINNSYYAAVSGRSTDLYARPYYGRPGAGSNAANYVPPAPQPLPSAAVRLSAPTEGRAPAPASTGHAMVPYNANEGKSARLLVLRRRNRN